ncbi:MAG: hypothetical protein ACHQYQ_01405 [Bacteriovoracales bacterium]
MITKILIFFLISINSFALSEKDQQDVDKEKNDISQMIDHIKPMLSEMNQIQGACIALKKFMGKEECPQYSKQIQRKLKGLENSLGEQKHAFFSYLKGAILFGYRCGSCDMADHLKYCPMMADLLSKYDYLK